MEDRVATTVMVPSVEQTETTGSISTVCDPRKHKAEQNIPIMSWVLKRQRLDVDVWTSKLLESLRRS